MNIAKYNQHLLVTKQTHTLQYIDQYNTMQNNLDNIIQKINEHILTHNRTLNMATPHCHSAIRKHRGGAGYYITDYKLLHDGLHSNKDPKNKEGKVVRMKWAKAIRGSIIKNFDKHCDDDLPPSPRPWRGEKREASPE